METINYSHDGSKVLDGKDGIVIRKHIAGIEAQPADVQGFALDYEAHVGGADVYRLLIKAGYVLHSGEGEQRAILQREQMRLFYHIFRHNEPPYNRC